MEVLKNGVASVVIFEEALKILSCEQCKYCKKETLHRNLAGRGEPEKMQCEECHQPTFKANEPAKLVSTYDRNWID